MIYILANNKQFNYDFNKEKIDGKQLEKYEYVKVYSHENFMLELRIHISKTSQEDNLAANSLSDTPTSGTPFFLLGMVVDSLNKENGCARDWFVRRGSLLQDRLPVKFKDKHEIFMRIYMKHSYLPNYFNVVEIII